MNPEAIAYEVARNAARNAETVRMNNPCMANFQTWKVASELASDAFIANQDALREARS